MEEIEKFIEMFLPAYTKTLDETANKTYRKSKIKNVYSKLNKKQIQMYIKNEISK